MSEIPRVVMITGRANSGQSRFTNALRQLGWSIVSGSSNDENVQQQFRLCIQNNEKIVIDDSNMTVETRSGWFKLAQEMLQRDQSFHWMALVMTKTLEESTATTKQNSGWEDEVQNGTTELNFQLPSKTEGFEEILLFSDFDSALLSHFGDARDFTNASHFQSAGSHNRNHSQRRPPKSRDQNEGKISLQKSEIVLLFDLNGTLTSHTSKRRSSGINKLRPGTKHLLKLKGKFRLGLFSSATVRTVESVLELFRKELGEDLFEPELVFHREHTAPISKGFARKMDLKPWDTVKPLNPLFHDISRVVLFDDDHWKAARGEENNMVLIPGWNKEELEDSTIEVLVDEVLKTLGSLSEEQDVRNLTKTLSQSITTLAEKKSGLAEKESAVTNNNVVPMDVRAIIQDTGVSP